MEVVLYSPELDEIITIFDGQFSIQSSCHPAFILDHIILYQFNWIFIGVL